VAVDWSAERPLVAVQNREQTTLDVLAIDPDTGATQLITESTDPHWTSIVPGVPALLTTGELVWVDDRDNTRHLIVDGHEVSPPGLQVRRVLAVDGRTVLFSASTEQPEDNIWSFTPSAGCAPLTQTPGRHDAVAAGGTTVITSRTLDAPGARVRVCQPDGPEMEIRALVEQPLVIPRPHLFHVGDRRLPTAVLFPDGHVPGRGKLPVLMDPYAGPPARRVLADLNAYLLPQWWANQGYAVVIADGAGTPERDPAWERLIHHDKHALSLTDQISALHAAAEEYGDLDLGRVAIRGWSYGGFLAAMAVLRRPDVFHAAIAGATVTDQRLYDTHYQERYLGHPDAHPDVYERASLLDDAPNLRRPLLLIHGILDDNVLAAHTLQLSAALWAACRPHELVLLPATTHTPTDDDTLTNLLTIQADFLHRALPASSPLPD
jgi:dipeptidyl-peptidase-4